MKDLKEIHEQVVEDDSYNKDLVVSLEKLKVKSEERCTFVDVSQESKTERFEVTDWATQQICSRLGIPQSYYDKCPDELRNVNLSYWNGIKTDREVLLRTNKGKVRGFLSGRYGILNNSEVTRMLLEKNGIDEMTTKRYVLKDGTMHVYITQEGTINQTFDKSALFPGFAVTNSEIGESAFSVLEFIYRLVCSNGLVVTDSVSTSRVVHRGGIVDRAKALISRSSSVDFPSMVERARQDVFSEKDGVVEKLRRYNLGKAYSIGVKEFLDKEIGELEYNRYDVANAISQLDHDLGETKRFAIDVVAGRILRG